MSKTKKEVMTDDILKKSHYHEMKNHAPKVCQACAGMGRIRNRWREETCHVCEGEGVLFD